MSDTHMAWVLTRIASHTVCCFSRKGAEPFESEIFGNRVRFLYNDVDAIILLCAKPPMNQLITKSIEF